MRTEGAAHSDRSAAVTPPVVCSHPDDVAEVRAESDFRLFVRFHDGTSGMVDMAPLLASAHVGVFAALRDPLRFAQVGIELGAVTWTGGLDLAPDSMYAEFRQHGIWTPL